MTNIDKKIWNNAEFIFTKYPLYFGTKKGPWGRVDYTNQLLDFNPLKGLPVFVKDFEVNKPKKSTMVFTALGCVDIWINGKRVGNDELKPGWSSYDKRTLYYKYDVSEYINDGKNRILAVISNGWYSGRISGNYYGSHYPAVMICLSIEDKDGTKHIVSDDTWKSKIAGRILNADIWDGEYCDGRLDSYAEMSQTDYALPYWKRPNIVDYFNGEVTEFVGPKVQVRDEISRDAVEIKSFEGTKDNGTDFGEIDKVEYCSSYPVNAGKEKKIVIDLGQEMVGWAKIKVKGEKGTKIKIRYSEMLNDSGSKDRGNDGPKGGVYTINMRTAKAKGYYILNENGEEIYRPTFTFYGFRFVEISADADFSLLDFKAEVVGSVNEEIGHIETSDELVNKLISNTLWGQRGNYLFVPTDCPQRDERLGWTGDAQAFSTTAAYNANVLGFFHKWLQDMRDAQSDEGAYSDVVPRVQCCSSENATGWADAGIIIPYNMYKMFGDKTIIEEHYDSMEKYIAQLVKNFDMTGPIPRYGDWLSYDYCKNEFLSSAFLVHIIDLMTEMSLAIDKPKRADYYKDLRKQAYAYFKDTFMKEGELVGKTQCDYVVALAFDLLEGDYKQQAADELVAKIKENGNRLSTGFIGTYNLCPVLSKVNEDKMAYTLLMQKNEPSWLYSVLQGATTVWERWNTYTHENGFGDVGMNSFNHYAYGSICEWMYRYMAGIEAAAPGFSKLRLQPRIDTRTDVEIPVDQERMKWVKASYNSAAGLIESSWNTENGFIYECLVPNVPTILELPVVSENVKINGVEHKISEFEKTGDCIVIELKSGKYKFEQ